MSEDRTPGAAREKRPSIAKALFFMAVLGVMGAGLTAFALSLRSDEGPKVAKAAPEPISVSVRSVALQGSFQLEERFSGMATPARTSQLGFPSGGRIDRLDVDVGDRVERGQVLARLDTRGLRAQLNAAEASVAEARSALKLAQETVGRQRELNRRGHVSQQRVDEAVAQAETTAARVTAAQAQADALRVQIDLAQMTAPFAGVITQRFVDEGVIASPQAPVYELVETGAMEVRIGLPAEVARDLVPGDRYTLLDGERPVSATLRRTTGVIDARRRTVATVFDLDPDAGIASGAVVRLPMDRTVDERGAWVPMLALTQGSRGLWSLLVAVPDGGSGWIAERRLVEIVHPEGERAFVRGTLDDGDKVIVNGLQRLSPGMPVQPRDADLARAVTGLPAERND